MHELQNISPVDGRYHKQCAPLRKYFSEEALISYRVFVETEYFLALTGLPIKQLHDIDAAARKSIRSIPEGFSHPDAQRVKEIEKDTNHDIKAVEYFIKEKFESLGLGHIKEWVHFGLTSQDINNTAVPLSLKHALEQVIYPALNELLQEIGQLSAKWADIPMLAHTHGQPASPTTPGKELMVFHERLTNQIADIQKMPFPGKFGGATGNFNAHHVTFPDINWPAFADKLLASMGLTRSQTTTQIDHYDRLAALFDCLKRIATIIIDLDRDCWSYISMDYFKQKIKEGEVGSSAMPHKVNPIDFENAEGNAGIAVALFEHLSARLPVSRLQRDLSDSTVLRNIGVAVSHLLIAVRSTLRGLTKVSLNEEKIIHDLEDNMAVVAEAIQSILRSLGYPNPYEALKDLTRKGTRITRDTLHDFIDKLDIPATEKERMKKITPFTYTGIVPGKKQW